MEAFLIDPSRLVADIVGYVAELRNTFTTQQYPISDDDTALQKFCVKLETVMRHEQKEKYSLLGYRKDYWHFILEGISKDDGVKYVQAVPQMNTAQGKGRAFIRYALVQKTLADAVQRLLVNNSALSSWYKQEAIFRNPSLATALVNKLYDLNDVDFNLPCAGYDLDISWPAFSRRSFGEGAASGRRSSISSMSSVDFRNDRPDPLVGLATEVTSLKQLFSDDSAQASLENGESFDNISINDQPSVSELTLSISRVHQQALRWKSQMETERNAASKEIKKAHEDRTFAIRESELKTKQFLEKYSLLSKTASEESDAKCRDLKEKLSLAEKSLIEREAELSGLRNEISQSVSFSNNAQREAIELEKQLTSSERKTTELRSESEDLKSRLRTSEQQAKNFETLLEESRNKLIKLEEREIEYKEKLAEANGNLKAKEIALNSIQESFEKLNGMVFGSFEELESELKGRLMEREKGLQSQSLENKKLELNVVELQQHIRELRGKLSDANSEIQRLGSVNSELNTAKLEFQEVVRYKTENLQRFESLITDLVGPLSSVQDGEDTSDGPGMEMSPEFEQRSRRVVLLVNKLTKKLADITGDLTRAAQDLNEYRIRVKENDAEIKRLNASCSAITAELDTATNEIENVEKELCLTKEQLMAEVSLQESLRSELSAITAKREQINSELSRTTDENDRLVKVISSLEEELLNYKEQAKEVITSEELLQRSLIAAQEKTDLIESEIKVLQDCQTSLQDEITTLQEEKASSADELLVAKQQLEAANEGRIRAEHAQLKAQDELESVRCMMDQEIAALKFQLSSETIKYETEIKVLSAESQESIRYKERVHEQEEAIADLENNLKERSDAWLGEKRKYTNEIKHLRTEVQLCKNALDGTKQKVMSLENDLLLTTKQLEKERSRQEQMNRTMKQVEQQKGASEHRLMSQIADMERDSRELKDRLIALTQEKAELWRRADDMEYEIKVKASDRWVADEEVKQCTDCKTDFSFILRKHHCRVCGRIFCHSCTNNWVRTPHSRKMKRVCAYCLANDKQINPQHVRQRPEGDEYENMSDIDESRRSISYLSSEDEMRDSPNQADADVIKAKHDTGGEGSGTTAETNINISEPAATSSPKPDKKSRVVLESDGADVTRNNGNSKERYMSLQSVERSAVAGGDEGRVTTPEGEGFEVIDPHDELDEVPESRVVITDADIKAELVIPAVNDEQSVACHEVVPAGVRYVLPVMVGTPGVTLCWTFSTVYKSVIFGVAFKQAESKSDEEAETILPLSRYSSHQTPVEGDWNVASPGVYLMVFDNTFSRFTSKDVTCEINLKRRPSVLRTEDHVT